MGMNSMEGKRQLLMKAFTYEEKRSVVKFACWSCEKWHVLDEKDILEQQLSYTHEILCMSGLRGPKHEMNVSSRMDINVLLI